MEMTKRLGTSIVGCLLAVLAATGCNSTKVTQREQLVKEPLPRPANIYIQDFATTASEVPADSTLARTFTVESMPQTPEQLAAGKQLGADIAAQLAQQISAMGMPARRMTPGATPRVNDIVIRGYLVSIDEGSTAKRVAIGFGSGSSELRTVVEGFQVTANGMRKLGSGSVSSASGKSPGGAMGAAVFVATANPAGLIVSSGMKAYGETSGSAQLEGRAKATSKEVADVLKQRFKEQGWIE